MAIDSISGFGSGLARGFVDHAFATLDDFHPAARADSFPGAGLGHRQARFASGVQKGCPRGDLDRAL